MTERYIGLCMAAGGVVTGFDSVIGAVRGGKAKFVLIARDASERTKKQLTDKCTYYKIKYITGEYDSEAIARLLGKKALCSAAAFTGRGPWQSVVKSLTETSVDPEPVTKGNPMEKECCDDRKDDC